MSTIPVILSGPLAQAIGWALVHLLWQGVLVAAILAASLALLQRRSANARYLASCAALIALLFLGSITAVRAYRAESGPVTSTEATADTEQATPVVMELTPAPESASPVSEPSVPWTDRLAGVAGFANSHLPQIVLLWLVGVAFLSARLVVGWIGAYRMATRNAQPASPEWGRTLSRIAGALKLSRATRILESAAVEVPTVIGWLRPVVLLPIASLSGLTTQQIEMILAHELAHIRRHDFIVNLMQAVVETLLFYHPAVWWISQRIRVEREHCCDDVAVAMFGDPLQYARALTRFEELRLDPAHALLAANGGSLLTRIRRLVGARGESANWSSQLAAGAGLLTVLGALIIVPSLPVFADHQQQPQTPSAQTAPQAQHDSKDHDSASCPKGLQPHSEVDVNADSDAENDDNSDDNSDNNAVVADGVEGGIEGGIEGGVVDGVVAPVDVRPIMRLHIAPMVTGMARMASEMARAPRALLRLDDESKGTPRRKIGEGGKLTVDDLIELRSAGVNSKYIEDMRGAGIGDLSLDDLVELRVQGVTPDYIRGLREAGVAIKNAQAVVAMRAQGVTPRWLASMKSAGVNTSNIDELIALRAEGVSGEYIAAMRSAGYPNLTTKDLIAMRAQGVNPAFVKSLADAGFTNLSVKDLIRLAASGVDAEFMRDLAKYRTK
jgi:beta-lactamase regulating signal transducer with metallopeptidase domain